MTKRLGGIIGYKHKTSPWHLNEFPDGSNIGSTVQYRAEIHRYAVVVVVSHIQRIGCQPEKTTLHGGQSRSWSAEQGKKNKKSLVASPPPPPPRALFVWRKNKKIEKSRGASTCLGATQVGVTQVVSVRLASYKDSYDSSARPMGVASQNSTLPCAIGTFPVSLPLSSPGDVWPRLSLLPSTRP